MLHQRSKDICFLLLSKATLPNFVYRSKVRPLRTNGHGLHLHLGCGPNYLPSFVNVDANPLRKIDLWLDVRNGLPFRSHSVDSIYSTHMLEHFFPDELQRVLSECHRALKPGGGARFIVPSLTNAIQAYSEGRSDWFSHVFPRSYNSLGGRFANFIFCDGQHRSAFDFSHFEEVLKRAGFSKVVEASEGKSGLYDPVPAYESGGTDLPHSLYVEAFK